MARKETFAGAELVAAVNRYGLPNVGIAIGPFIVPAPDDPGSPSTVNNGRLVVNARATGRRGRGGRCHGGGATGGKWV